MEDFARRAFLDHSNELDRLFILSWYAEHVNGEAVSFKEFAKLMHVIGLPSVNLTRLRRNARMDRRFVLSVEDVVRVRLDKIAEAEAMAAPHISVKKVKRHSGSIVSAEIYASAPSYVRRIADQVNATYETGCFDATAVMMRRLFEVLLILSYRKLGEETRIMRADGTHKNLEAIVADAKVFSALGLSRNTKAKLDAFRDLGNFSAHRIEYSARQGDIEPLALHYRASIEELLVKSGLDT